MTEIRADIAIAGAGIAGAGLAAALERDFDIILLEQESRPGYHSTGRSAAIFIQNYGNDTIRALSRASAPLYTNADPEFFPQPLLSSRGILFVTDDAGIDAHMALLKSAGGLAEITPDEAAAMVPLLRREWIRAAAYEADARDIDVDALHQGWLRKARARTRLITNAAVAHAEFVDGVWRIETAAGKVEARIMVNAAGAWADRVAAACGVTPVGLTPMRRSMAVLPMATEFSGHRFPLVAETADNWYFKQDAGRLLVSPADEDPVEPHDAYVDDMVLAEGLHRYQQAVTVPVTHVEGSWAGLRTFAPDRTPVVGFDAHADGFFWLAGQGGYGIQTAPALSDVAARLIRGEAYPSDLAGAVSAMSPGRFDERA